MARARGASTRRILSFLFCFGLLAVPLKDGNLEGAPFSFAAKRVYAHNRAASERSE